MAQVEHLPIYRTALKLAVHLETVVRGFPRYSKYTLGSELRSQGQQVLLLIVRAHGNVAGRVERLRELRTVVESLLVTARLCHETKGFKTFAHFATVAELAAQVARQTEGWLKKSDGARRVAAETVLLLGAGRTVVQVCETGRQIGRLRERLPQAILSPVGSLAA